MKNLIVILTTVLLLSAGYNLSPAQVTQQWVQRYNGPENGDDNAYSIAVDGAGNVYVTGNGYTTIKYNSNGDSLWVRIYTEPNEVGSAVDIAVDGAGNVYVAGTSSGISGADFITIKYNSNGDSLWTRRLYGIGVDYYASSLAVDGSGNVFVTGRTTAANGYTDYVTIGYDSIGVAFWFETYNGLGNRTDYATSIAVDDSGYIYVTGTTEHIATENFDYTTIKYDIYGNEHWAHRYNNPQFNIDIASSIAVDGSGYVYVTGSSTNSVTGEDYATIKISSSGGLEWVRRYNGFGNNSDQAAFLAVDGSGNVYVTGYSTGIGTGDDYATIKYNSNGDSLWVKRYNGPGNGHDFATSLGVDGSGNVYVTGNSPGIGTGLDYATISYNSNGDSLWVQRYNGPGNQDDAATSLALDGSGNVYVTGYSWGNGTSYDYATIKYSTIYRTLHLTVFIEGFYNGSTHKMIRDTVRVYLRNSTVPYNIVDLSKAFLDSLGKGTLNFFNASNSTPYYIVIKHRNSIETWSSGGNSFSFNNLTYDFTTGGNKAYGNNQIRIDHTSRFANYSGDVNQDGIVDLADVSLIDNDSYNSVNGYVSTDVDGDNAVDLSDGAITDNNAFRYVRLVRP